MSYDQKQKKRLSPRIFLGTQRSFDIHHTYVPKCKVLRSSKVDEAQSFDLKLEIFL